MAPSRSCPGGTADPPWAELRHPAQHGGSLRPTAGAAHLPGDVCAVAHSPLAPSWLAYSGRPGRRHVASPGVGGPIKCGLVWRPADRGRDELQLRVERAASPPPSGFADAPPTGLDLLPGPLIPNSRTPGRKRLAHTREGRGVSTPASRHAGAMAVGPAAQPLPRLGRRLPPGPRAWARDCLMAALRRQWGMPPGSQHRAPPLLPGRVAHARSRCARCKSGAHCGLGRRTPRCPRPERVRRQEQTVRVSWGRPPGGCRSPGNM